ncbi:unnamed protein product [Peniophora sp. CBMAI 1063]|nr:unnamed protein product [Peniophora sp. CBMAI 1063]
MEAVNRQALKGAAGNQSDTLLQLLKAYTVIQKYAMSTMDPQSAVPVLIREGCMVEIQARGLRVCVTEGNRTGLTYYMCMTFLRTFKPCALATDRLSTKNPIRKALRQGFREHWYSTLLFLRRTRARATSIREHDKVLDFWRKLGEDLGFDEAKQREEYERELRRALRRCSRKECPYHAKEPPVSLRVCKGCTDARYCSRACQRQDWKEGHKNQYRSIMLLCWMLMPSYSPVAHRSRSTPRPYSEDIIYERPGRGLITFLYLVTEANLCAFIREVVSQDDFFDEYPDFVMSVLDIVMSIVDVSRKAPSLLDPLKDIVPALCTTAWENRDLLADDNGVDQYYSRCRHGVRDSLYYVVMALVQSSPEQYNCDVAIRRAALLCWFYGLEFETSTDLVISARVLSYATRDFPADFYPGEPPDPNTPRTALTDFLRIDVVPALGVKPYLERLLKTLQNPALLNNSLIWTVSSVCRTIANHPTLLANIVSSGVLSALVEAVNKQTLTGDPGTLSQVLNELVGLYSLTIRISSVVPDVHSVIPAFVREGRMVMEARALRVCVSEGQDEGLDYNHCLYSLKGFRTCALTMNKLSPKNTLRKSIRQGFREHWYPTLDFLRQSRSASPSINEHDEITTAWQSLGEAMGFAETTQKAEYEREVRKALRRCTWKECRYHTEESPVSLRSCKGCAEAKYCSQSCQRKDWKDGHKSRCKRIHDTE